MNEINFSAGRPDDVLVRLHASGSTILDRQTLAAATDQDLILFAEYRGHVVGYLAASPDSFGGIVVWEHVVVPDYRDRGIGRRLLLEAAHRSLPMSRLTIDPTGDFIISTVDAYYSRLGFPAAGEDRFKVSVPAHQVVDAIGEQLEEHTNLGKILRRKSNGVLTVDPDASVAEALAILSENRIGCVVVSGDGTTVLGMLGERNIVTGLHTHGAVLLEQPVRAHMSTSVVTADVDDLIADVMEIVTLERLRHVPVTENGKLVGLVSVGDLLVFRMREHDMGRPALHYREP